MQQQTTIRVSKELVNALQKFKEDPKESYEDIIWDFIEPFLELSPEAKKDIAKSLEEIKRGEFIIHEELKAELGFN
ncbi:MAG: hypothetical protein U9Q06_01825 [Nanoarchaeota archaeon]|nr:hypothetical protein [Nanoarchaeota archaeon]